jgi:Ca2+-binding RTX toxin-like protein
MGDDKIQGFEPDKDTVTFHGHTVAIDRIEYVDAKGDGTANDTRVHFISTNPMRDPNKPGAHEGDDIGSVTFLSLKLPTNIDAFVAQSFVKPAVPGGLKVDWRPFYGLEDPYFGVPENQKPYYADIITSSFVSGASSVSTGGGSTTSTGGSTTSTGDSTTTSNDSTTTSSEGVTLTGDGGPNTMNGGAGDDTLIGKAGKDTLDGKAGNDTLDAGPNRDTLIGGAGDDMLLGGDGPDTAVYLLNAAAYEVTSGSNGQFFVAGADGTDTLIDIETLQFADVSGAPGEFIL